MNVSKKILLSASIAFLLLFNSAEAKVFTGQAMLAVDAKQTKVEMEQIALAFAKREALESAAVYIDSVTKTHMSVVNHDTVSTFVKGIAKLKPETLKKRYEKTADGGQILHLQAAFDIDEKEVEKMIERYQYDENVIWKYKKDLERFDSLLLKYEYLLRKRKRIVQNKDVNVLSNQERNEIITKLNTGTAEAFNEVLKVCISYLEMQKYKEVIAITDLMLPVAHKFVDTYQDVKSKVTTSAIYTWRAQSLVALQRYEEADADVDKALMLFPYFRPLLLKLDYLQRMGQRDKMLPYIKQMAEIDPVAGNSELAMYYAERGEFALAHQAIDMSIEEERKTNHENRLIRMGQCYSAKADFYERENKLEQALDCYNKSITICPTYSMVYFHRGVFYEKLQKGSEALADFTKAIELMDNLPADLKQFKTRYLASSYFNRAAINSHLNRWQECLQDVNKAIELNPDGSSFYALKRMAEEKLRSEYIYSKRQNKFYLNEHNDFN